MKKTASKLKISRETLHALGQRDLGIARGGVQAEAPTQEAASCGGTCQCAAQAMDGYVRG
jgi:hypothetical protein